MESQKQLPVNYDVFLSFPGEDTRKAFTDNLYSALINSGFKTYYHQGQEPIDLVVEKAIKESMVAMIVLTKSYTESIWCVTQIIERKHSNSNGVVFPIFYHDVTPQQVIDTFDKYLQTHKTTIKDNSFWLNQLSSSSSKYQLQHGSEAVFIQTIVKDVVALSNLTTTLFNVPSYSVGIQSRLKEVDLWLKDSSTDITLGVISGMGGIGKTTLAKVAYNMNFSHFEATSFLPNIRLSSQLDCTYGLLRLRAQLLADIHRGSIDDPPVVNRLQDATRPIVLDDVDNADAIPPIVKLEDAVRHKKVLLVLDDVSLIDQLDALVPHPDLFSQGSKIIVTTRSEGLLDHVNHACFRIKPLDYHESLRLFSLHAFSQDRPFQGHMELSQRLVQHCEGRPLALEIVGSTLFGKALAFWETTLNELQAIPDEQIRKTIQAPEQHHRFTSSQTKTDSETLTTEGSLPFKNEALGKRKRLDDFDDESTPTGEEKPRLFKRLLRGLFSLLKTATSSTKIPTEQGSSLLISKISLQAGFEFMESRKAGRRVPSLHDDASTAAADEDFDDHDDGSSMYSSGSSDASSAVVDAAAAGCGKSTSVAMPSNGSEVQGKIHNTNPSIRSNKIIRVSQ